MKITRKELVKTAKEFNELMDLDPAIATGKEVADEVLLEKISEAAEMLEEEDEISETAQAVVDYIAEQKEEAGEVVDTEEKEEAELEESMMDLVAASDYKALKAMVKDYPEFKGIDIALYPAKKEEDLRARMVKVLTKVLKPDTKVEEIKAPAKKDEKPAGNSGVKHISQYSNTTIAPPGVIATIVSCIEGAGKKGICKDEILAELIKVFPDKDSASMKNTINVQVPSRISKEKFKVEVKDGKYFKA